MARFNLMTVCPSPFDPTSFYRVLGPLAALRKQAPDLQVQVIDNMQWGNFAISDALLIQRPYREVDYRVAVAAAKHGLPIWVEFDDDIFAIPFDNPAHDLYMSSRAREIAIAVTKLAQHVSVSTEALAEVFRKWAPGNVSVIPNALMTNTVGRIPTRARDSRPSKLVMWRGSSTHQRDIDTYTPQIVQAARRNPEYGFAFQGYSTYQIHEALGDQVTRGMMQDPVDYFGAIHAVYPKVLMVPLADNRFNRSKSNIAWIEATYAGAICVAPNWPEWQRPGIINYNDTSDFADVLDQAINTSDETHRGLWSKSFGYISNKLDIDAVNVERSRILDKMMRLSRDRDFAETARRRMFAPPSPEQLLHARGKVVSSIAEGV